MSFAVTGRTGDISKPIYSIAQSNEQGEFVYDGSGSIVCAITASNFEDEQAVIDFLPGSVFKLKGRGAFVKDVTKKPPPDSHLRGASAVRYMKRIARMHIGISVCEIKRPCVSF